MDKSEPQSLTDAELAEIWEWLHGKPVRTRTYRKTEDVELDPDQPYI